MYRVIKQILLFSVLFLIPKIVFSATDVQVIGSVKISTNSNTVQATQSGTWTAQPGNTQNTTPWLTLGVFNTSSDTYTGTGNGTVVNVATRPVKSFSIYVYGNGSAATTWDIRLEGSLDNVNFTQILQHTNTTGDKIVLYSGNTLSPSTYFRSRVAALTLGTAVSVTVLTLGTQ